MSRFFRVPFGLTGDRVAIPDPVQAGGEVSFTQGFGPNYEIAPGDPNWEPVPRPETNGLYYDITDNIRQYQLFGAPEWVDASQNGGVAVSYAINATVRHNDLVYRSLVANNTVEPGTDATKWGLDNIWGQATTAVFGVARLATNPETIARTATDRVVTPAGLGAAMDALLLNNPVYPDVLTVGGVFSLSNPANNVRIAAGTDWVLRGAYKYTSVQTDLPTVASKTYHLRWDRVNGFTLYDLASGSYNPSSLPETDATFDTTFDSMLIARVVTSAGNAATITTLANKNNLRIQSATSGAGARPGGDIVLYSGTFPLNWARSPVIQVTGSIEYDTSGTTPTGSNTIINEMTINSQNRYSVNATLRNDINFSPNGSVQGKMSLLAIA